MKTVLSSCLYCGVGCRLGYQVENERIIKVVGDPSDPVSKGKPCLKGLTIHEVVAKNRLLAPQIRINGQLRRVSWKKALEYIFRKTKDLAPQEVFFSGSGKITNEDNFVIEKFARLVFQTNNIDNCCSRLCHQATVQAMNDCFGTPNLTWNRNLKKIDALLVIGSNPASNYPVFWNQVLAEKKKRKLKILSVQSVLNLTAKTLSKTADFNLIIEQGAEMVILNGIVNYLLNKSAYPPTNKKIEGFARLKNRVTSFSPDWVAKIAKIKKTQFEKLAQAIAESKTLGAFHGMGLTQHVNGIENIHSLLNLVILKNGYLLTQRGEINVQGAGDMACSPVGYPSGAFTTKEKLQAIWGTRLPAEKGKNMIEAFYLAPVKAAFISGFNPAQSLPDLSKACQNLKKMFLVVIDSYPNRTTQLAEVILPSPLLIERKGTITNGERRVRLVTPVVSPAGQSWPEWRIYQELAKLWGKEKEFVYKNEKEIFVEITQVVGDYQLLDPGKIYQGEEGFPQKVAKHRRFYPEKWEGYDDPRSQKYPFLLTTFRSAHLFLTSEATDQSETLKRVESQPGFIINPQDAASLELQTGQRIEVESSVAKLRGKVKISPEVPQGIIGASFHSPKLLINRLFPLEFDEETFTPNFKATAVRINRA